MPRSYLIGFALWALVLSPFISKPASAAVQTFVYDINAYIDGNDYLLLKGATLQWNHRGTGAASVGRQAGNDYPTFVSSSLDGAAGLNNFPWTPSWPNPVPDEIRFAAFSSVFSNLNPVLPTSGPMSLIGLQVLAGRGSLTVDQLPTADNNNTTIIHFADGGSGAAWLNGRITITAPEPHALMFALQSLLLLRRRARSL